MTTTTPAPITIALAQLPVSKAAVDDNLQMHLAYIERAAALGANVVAFPELSLIGYELALLSQLAMPRDDTTFAALTAAAVASQQADVYLASALISPGDYTNDAELLATIAKRHQLPVLLVNHVSTTGGWQTCGNSGGWNAAGELTVKANGTQPSLVLCCIHSGAIRVA